MLQIPSTFTDLVEWFGSLNIEFKILIAIVAILLSMVLIFIAFKLLEVFILLLKVILDGILKIFRISSKNMKKISKIIEKSEKPVENDSLEQDNDEEFEDINSIEFDKEEEEQKISEEEENFREEDTGKAKANDPNNRSDNQEYNHEKSKNIIQCPNCGTLFSNNSFSKIGDTLFVSCEECGKKYISNGEYLSEDEE